jgi:PAS domain S-box-containing protein
LSGDKLAHAKDETERRIEFCLDEFARVQSIRVSEVIAHLAISLTEGLDFRTVLHPEDLAFAEVTRNYIASQERGEATCRLRILRKHNRYSTMQATFRPAPHLPNGVHLHLVPDDFDHARRTERQMRKVVEGSAQAIVVRTSDRILFINDAFGRLLGFENARELIAQDFSFSVSAIHPDDREGVMTLVRQRIGGGKKGVTRYTFRLFRRDGSMIWVDTMATRVMWNGEPASLSWMIDVSDQKRMEAELLESKESAEFANRAKTEFLANMSHELRTPLNAIIGFAEVIKEQMFGAVGQNKYVDYAADIHKSGEHLLEIINDILDLAKLEAGKMELREGTVSLPRLIEQCTMLLRNKAEKAGVTLITEIDPDLPELNADERAVKQILLNFLSNAVKFTPARGTVTTRAGFDPMKGVMLSVTDTGIGMNQKEIETALAPFGQVDSKLSRQHEGTGLGLPITRSLIRLHGGDLTVDSEPNKGTTMTANFPLSRAIRAAA